MHPDTDYSSYLIKCLRRIEFEARRTQELAYFAFTGKIENIIRDKISYYLQNALKKERILIGRELKKRDIVIFERYRLDNEPDFRTNAVIELTATHIQSLGKETQRSSYFRKMDDDIRKARKFRNTNQVYIILLATDFSSQIAPKYRIISKYAKSSIHKTSSASLFDNVSELLQKKYVQIKKDKINIGSIFDTKLSLYYWVIGPIK